MAPFPRTYEVSLEIVSEIAAKVQTEQLQN